MASEREFPEGKLSIKSTIEGMLEMGNEEVPQSAIAMLDAKLNEFDVK